MFGRTFARANVVAKPKPRLTVWSGGVLVYDVRMSSDSKNAEEAKRGHLHPLTIVMREAVGLLVEMGFEIAEGPEIESEYYNFDALNVPKDHPSRDMQDTFWLKTRINADHQRISADEDLRESALLMRTQTSAVQVRYMQIHKPPFAVAVPGKVFRNEATDATHEAQFYQLEGLVIGKDISLAHLKGTLDTFFKKLYGENTALRFRPSFFPFTEPSVEIDVSCFKCGGTGCSVCKGTGFIEVMGAGMVHPNVLKSGGIDPREYRGFAFGVGVDRLAMLKWGIDDVRFLYTGDLRVVNQF